MPELPEVETVRRDLADVLPGRTITGIQVFDPKLTAFARVAESLVGQDFVEPQRRGKFLLLPFAAETRLLVIHLRMTGQMIYRRGEHIFASGHPARIDPQHLPDRHTRVQFTLDDGGELFFNDQRRFGTVLLLTPAAVETMLARFGIEPGHPGWTQQYFDGLVKNRTTSIKALLLNQNLIFGLGNIYADEVCFRSGVLPMRPAGKLTKAERERIFQNCSAVLAEAIECRGTSIRDFVDGSGRPGGFAEKLRVYQRQGQECLVCATPISKVKAAGRGTHYCSRCQK